MSITMPPCDPDRAVDQFVDEVLDRIAALHALTGSDEWRIDPAATRRVGQAIIATLQADERPDVARHVLDALWTTHRGGRIPAGWSQTPLGGLVGRPS